MADETDANILNIMRYLDPADSVILCPKCQRHTVEVVMDPDGIEHWHCEWCNEPVNVYADTYFERQGNPPIYEDWES